MDLHLYSIERLQICTKILEMQRSYKCNQSEFYFLEDLNLENFVTDSDGNSTKPKS